MFLVRVDGADGTRPLYTVLFGGNGVDGKPHTRKRVLKARGDDEAIAEADALCQRDHVRLSRLNIRTGERGETMILAAWEFRSRARRKGGRTK